VDNAGRAPVGLKAGGEAMDEDDWWARAFVDVVDGDAVDVKQWHPSVSVVFVWRAIQSTGRTGRSRDGSEEVELAYQSLWPLQSTRPSRVALRRALRLVCSRRLSMR